MLNQPIPAKSPNYIFILSVLANLSFIITIGILFTKLQSTPHLPTEVATTITPSPIPKTNTTTTLLADPMATTSASFSFTHPPGWQFLQHVDPSPLNGYIFTYTYMNLNLPFITGEFETKNDLQLIVAKPTPVKAGIQTLPQFIKDMYPENQAKTQTVTNSNNLEITKWAGEHPINNEPLTLYFFTIPSSTTNYFAQLSINSTTTSENLQPLLESLKTSL